MKTKICAALALSASLLGASAASAEEGFYYGGSIGGSSFNSGRGNFVETEGNSLTLGVVAGYSFELQNGWSAGVEGSFDFLTGGAMSYSNGQPSCTSRSPDWCDVDSIVRVRGFVGVPVNDNLEFLAMGGFATASGFAEDGPTTFVDSRAKGFTVGVGAQTQTGFGTTRFELIYDEMSNVTPNRYDKTLKVISLKTSILF
ncbi:outer membrane beta-barrel protein [uncultured Aliiroseovarius sp.]|uniref:outer membrane protein n=1 Tax=uncultured Aliiroseovarius sp. TaxID=1658783 RepID=UPI002613AA54|nr:outer membrane beta-barrel protein [uncultured Aliiroseovarius sp.]